MILNKKHRLITAAALALLAILASHIPSFLFWGNYFSLIDMFVLLCGLLCGPLFGAAVGGVVAVYHVSLVTYIPFLISLGLVSGILHGKFKMNMILATAGSILVARALSVLMYVTVHQMPLSNYRYNIIMQDIVNLALVSALYYSVSKLLLGKRSKVISAPFPSPHPYSESSLMSAQDVFESDRPCVYLKVGNPHPFPRDVSIGELYGRWHCAKYFRDLPNGMAGVLYCSDFNESGNCWFDIVAKNQDADSKPLEQTQEEYTPSRRTRAEIQHEIDDCNKALETYKTLLGDPGMRQLAEKTYGLQLIYDNIKENEDMIEKCERELSSST
jgi:hypothetical protein